jgi:hypothetical protein
VIASKRTTSKAGTINGIERPSQASNAEIDDQTDKSPAFPLDAGIGLAVPGRPIGPWSRRTGAPEASATLRDRKTLPRRVRGLPTTQVVTEERASLSG